MAKVKVAANGNVQSVLNGCGREIITRESTRANIFNPNHSTSVNAVNAVRNATEHVIKSK